MRYLPLAVVAAVFLTVPANASFLEENTGLKLQNDGGIEGDAPDTCEALDALRQVGTLPEEHTHGVLVPVDDESDFYLLTTEASDVGLRLRVSVDPADLNLANLDIDVQLPNCGGSVFDPETFDEQRAALNSDPQHSETEPPAEGEKTVAVHSTTGYACDPNEWHFLINQVSTGPAPDHIRLKWSNGDVENVPIVKTTPATVVHYRTTSHLDQPLWSANVNIFAAWNGQFNLGSGPCNGPATPPPDPFVEPFLGGSFGEFTVAFPEPHPLQVIFIEETVPQSIPVSCHDLCGGALDAMGLPFGYDALGQPADQ